MIAYAPMLAFLPNIGMPEMIVIGVVALLLFGKRLPEVGRSLGRGIVEFKKGLKDTTDEISQVGTDVKSDSPRKIDSSATEQK
ncbi:MAG: twin-arginine translocase TatA/TatE family subunit [Planctomycetota bacterium]